MVPLRMTLAALLIAAAAPADAVELAQNAPITNPPSVITPPAAVMPDLWLWSPVITAECTAEKNVIITVTATFKNIGKGPAVFAAQHRVASSTYGYASGEAKLVDPGKKPFQSFATGPLTVAKGASHQVKLTIGPMSRYKAMSAPGQYIASAIINPNKSVPESNLNNNGVGGYVSDPCFGK
jgi:hypothetical protein